MEYIKEININEAIIHMLDNNLDKPILNEYKLKLTEETYNFLLKHINKCCNSDDLKYAVFKEKSNIKELSEKYLNGQSDLISISKDMAIDLFNLMQCTDNEACDLIVVSISTEFGPIISILKMDYSKKIYDHNIKYIDDKVGIEIISETKGLPDTKIKECAFIKPIGEDNEFDLFVIDTKKKNKNEDCGANYFIDKYLSCKVIKNNRDITKEFADTVEEWTRINLKENAEAAEKVRSLVKRKLKEEEGLNLYQVSEELFENNKEYKTSFLEYANEKEVADTIEIDKEWVEKKLRRISFKIDKDIDLNINEEAYNDINRFQIDRNGDGSISIIIKNVINYIEKWK